MTESNHLHGDPETWDPLLDAVAAAPQHHEVLYEDDDIRVLSVTIRSGEQEPLHHHRWPAVFVIDRLVALRDFDASGREIPLPIPNTLEVPLIVEMSPQPLHSVRNEGATQFHGTRIEFKKPALRQGVAG